MNLEVTEQQLNVIANALAARPWAEVNDLLAHLQAQLRAQQAAAAQPLREAA